MPDFIKAAFVLTGLSLMALGLSSCLTQRTVSQGGQVQSEQYIIKRPVKELLENTE